MEKCYDNINKDKIYVAQIRSGEQASQWVAFGGKYSDYDHLKPNEDISANFLFKKGRGFFKREDLFIMDDITIEDVYKNNLRVDDNDIQLSLGKKVKVTAPNKTFNIIGYISYIDPKVIEVLSMDNSKLIIPHEFVKIYADDITINDTLSSFSVDDSMEEKTNTIEHEKEKDNAIIYKLMGKIKSFCLGCEAWSGTDCIRNPYTEGCLKDSNENNICLAKDVTTSRGTLKTNDHNEPIIIKMDNDIKNYEMVNHPQHYRPGTYEAINVIEAWDLNFSLGSAIKYISRCGLKPDASLDNKYKAIEDLRKAIWYLNREIERIDKSTVKNS